MLYLNGDPQSLNIWIYADIQNVFKYDDGKYRNIPLSFRPRPILQKNYELNDYVKYFEKVFGTSKDNWDNIQNKEFNVTSKNSNVYDCSLSHIINIINNKQNNEDYLNITASGLFDLLQQCSSVDFHSDPGSRDDKYTGDEYSVRKDLYDNQEDLKNQVIIYDEIKIDNLNMWSRYVRIEGEEKLYDGKQVLGENAWLRLVLTAWVYKNLSDEQFPNDVKNTKRVIKANVYHMLKSLESCRFPTGGFIYAPLNPGEVDSKVDDSDIYVNTYEISTENNLTLFAGINAWGEIMADEKRERENNKDDTFDVEAYEDMIKLLDVHNYWCSVGLINLLDESCRFFYKGAKMTDDLYKYGKPFSLTMEKNIWSVALGNIKFKKDQDKRITTDILYDKIKAYRSRDDNLGFYDIIKEIPKIGSMMYSGYNFIPIIYSDEARDFKGDNEGTNPKLEGIDSHLLPSDVQIWALLALGIDILSDMFKWKTGLLKGSLNEGDFITYDNLDPKLITYDFNNYESGDSFWGFLRNTFKVNTSDKIGIKGLRFSNMINDGTVSYKYVISGEWTSAYLVATREMTKYIGKKYGEIMKKGEDVTEEEKIQASKLFKMINLLSTDYRVIEKSVIENLMSGGLVEHSSKHIKLPYARFGKMLPSLAASSWFFLSQPGINTKNPLKPVRVSYMSTITE